MLLFAPCLRADLVEPTLLDEAGLYGGAMTAPVRDPSAAWYNPAGLGLITGGSFSLSATVLGAQIYQAPESQTIQLPDREESVRRNDLNLPVAPAATLFAAPLSPRLVGAVGLLVQTQPFVSDGSERRGQAIDYLPGKGRDGLYQYRSASLASVRDTSYRAALALGWRMTPRLRLGIAVYAIFQQRAFTGSTWESYTVFNQAGRTEYTDSTVLDSSSLTTGGQASLGLQWDAGRGLRLGLLLRGPALVFGNSLLHSTSSRTTTRDAPGQTPWHDALFVRQPPQNLATLSMVQPVRLTAGLCWARGRGELSVEGDIAPPIDGDPPRDTSGGLRLGAMFRPNPRLALGGGLFGTWRGDGPPTQQQDRIDYYGVTVGVSLRRSFQLVRKSARDPAQLTLLTLVSLRYAFGVGQTLGERIDPQALQADPGRALLGTYAADLRVHDIAVQWGGGVEY